MKKKKSPTLPKIDFEEIKQDFQNLDPNDPGQWPMLPRATTWVVLLLATVALVGWFDWKTQYESLEKVRGEETQLREDWTRKKRLAVNLDEYKRQLDETNRQFGALLKQLPNRAEMDSLLADINQAGIGRGLQFELFKPGADVVRTSTLKCRSMCGSWVAITTLVRSRVTWRECRGSSPSMTWKLIGRTMAICVSMPKP